MNLSEKEIKSLIQEYKEKIRVQLELPKEGFENKAIATKEYIEFKKQYMPKNLSIYEKLCNFAERTVKVTPDKKEEEKLKDAINICHLNITPTGAKSFSVFVPLLITVIGSLISFAIFQSFFFVFFFLIAGLALMTILPKIPIFIADNWRMKASNQMVLCVFYVVTYMRHTSNLERAIEFAADHLAPPLSLDLKKVLWDVETQKYESIRESLDIYLETWKKWNLEFIEAFHLIESSLYEGDETRRINLLDKSLEVILEETYEKMLHYAQELKSPITMLNMLGIILPILGLVILPLVVSFMPDVQWYHLAMLYNVTLPLAVYYLGKQILSKRPTGYGDTDISETNPEFKKYRNFIINISGFEIKIKPIVISIFLGTALFLIGVSPLILHNLYPDFDMDLFSEKFKLLEYRTAKETGKIIGPYGLGSSILSLSVTLAFGLAIGFYFNLKSQNVIKIRENSKKLEKEFASALFQLGNRLGDGLPAEIACSKVAEVMEGTVSGSFFELVALNIRRLGMSVQEAIFNKKVGALVQFPSNIIESSMKVLIESVKKGPRIAANAIMNISRYIKEIHRVDERLKDLLADVISSMKSQINFLTPVIAGIVIGITSMITYIIGQLGQQLGRISENAGATAGNVPLGGNIGELFGDGIPTYYFQIIVGLYVVQIIYILTILANGIENGSDKLGEEYYLGKTLIRSTLMYCAVSLVIMLVFNFIAGTIIGPLAVSTVTP